MAWIDQVNTQRHIEAFISESFLRTRLQYDDFRKLNWMRIFNSKMELSDEFIVAHIDYVRWNWLFRPLSEPILDRYASKVVQWNAQLHSTPRTIEFLYRHQYRINWAALSEAPPLWFTDLHFELFSAFLDWARLTKSINRLGLHLIRRFADQLDWEWITKNGIRDEAFAQRFVSRIIWNHPCLDTRMLSTEFLYEVYLLRQASYQMPDGAILFVSPTKKIVAALSDRFADGFDPNDKLPIGATITKEFAIEHHYELDWTELNRRGMISNEIAEALVHLPELLNDEYTTTADSSECS